MWDVSKAAVAERRTTPDSRWRRVSSTSTSRKVTTMTMNDSINRKSVVKGIELRADTLIHGLETALPAGVTQLIVSGVSIQVVDLIKQVQDDVQPWKDARAAHAALRQFTQDRPAASQKLGALIADAKIAITTIVGRENEVLTNFGFKPQKRRKPLTSDQKAIRAAKARLTRQKRHTLGSKQKAALKATETPVLDVTFGNAPESSSSTQAPTGTPKP
jgi:hypothetical protein